MVIPGCDLKENVNFHRVLLNFAKYCQIVIVMTTVIFGTMKNGNLKMNNLSMQSLFQNGASDIPEIINILNRFFIKKIQILYSLDHPIQVSKKLQILFWTSTVGNDNGSIFMFHPIGCFLLPLQILTSKVWNTNCNSCNKCLWHRIAKFEYRIFSFLSKWRHLILVRIDGILDDVSVAKNNCLMQKYESKDFSFSVPKNNGNLTHVS